MGVAVVTGASTGIGYATALRLARDGHNVVATMRTPDACNIAQAADAARLSIEVKALDVTDAHAVGRVFGDIGDVDVLVCNAGISSGLAVEEADVETFASVMDTNYLGAVRCIKAVLPSMREREAGAIVGISSQAGRLAVPSLSAYAASKWALEALLEALAAEVHAFGIRVAIIEPGAIITPIIQKAMAHMPAPDSPYMHIYRNFGAVSFNDFGKGSPPEEVADCVSVAITAEPPRLRWPVGQGAERNLARRASMTDEEAVATWNFRDPDAFLDAMLGDDR